MLHSWIKVAAKTLLCSMSYYRFMYDVTRLIMLQCITFLEPPAVGTAGVTFPTHAASQWAIQFLDLNITQASTPHL
jgi:hypothetical protein